MTFADLCRQLYSTMLPAPEKFCYHYPFSPEEKRRSILMITSN